MLDEVHERTVQIDIIMGLLKKILKKRNDLRLIISSATVDAEYIRDFFNNNYNEWGLISFSHFKEQNWILIHANSKHTFFLYHHIIYSMQGCLLLINNKMIINFSLASLNVLRVAFLSLDIVLIIISSSTFGTKSREVTKNT